MKKLSIIPLLILLLGSILFTAACSTFSEEEAAQAAPADQEAAQEEEQAVPIEVALVETGDISLIFSYSGNVQPKDEVNLTPGASGQIESLLIEVGDKVKAGEAVAIIEDDTYLAQLKQAQAGLKQANLNLAKMELGSRPEEIAAAQAAVELAKAALNDVVNISDDERTQSAAALAQAEEGLRQAQSAYDKIAWAGDVGQTPQAAALQRATIAYEQALAGYNLQTNPSDSTLSPLMLQLAQAELQLALILNPYREIDYELARVAVQQAETSLELANLQLEETTITAPFDGVVSELFISEGSRVGPQSPIASFISQKLEVEIDVEESRISQVSDGQSASLNVTAYPGQDFPGVVTRVAPTANQETRTFSVKVTPTEGTDLLRGGMFADVSVLAQEKKNTVLAPRTAITVGEEPTAYVVNDDNTVEQRSVTTGLFDSNQIEILSGLQPGEMVVTAGQPNLTDGTTVEITNDAQVAE